MSRPTQSASAYEDYMKKCRELVDEAARRSFLYGDDRVFATWPMPEKETVVEQSKNAITIVMIKSNYVDNMGIAENESKRGLFSKGDTFEDDLFKTFIPGTRFNAVYEVGASGVLKLERVYHSKNQVITQSGEQLIAAATGSPVWSAVSPGAPTIMPVPVVTVTPASGGVFTAKVKFAGDEAGIISEAVDVQDQEVEERVPTPLDGYHIGYDARLAFNTARKMSLSNPERAVKIMMVGPSGYGKTTLPKIFSEVTSMQFMRMNCATIRDPEEWFGYREAREGSTVFIRSEFGKAIEQGNLVVVLDEFNRLEPWLHNTLFPLLDDAGKTVVHEEEFSIGPNVIVVGTINTGYKYTGTFELDEALMNRFDFVVEVGPLKFEEEVRVLQARTGVTKMAAQNIAKTANVLRQSDFVCSTRTTLLIATMMGCGMQMREAFETAVVRRVPTDNNGNALRKQVIDLINTHVGVLTDRTLVDDVFSGSVAVKEMEEPDLKHELTLWHDKTSGLGFLNLIRIIREMPLKETNGAMLDMQKAQACAESIREGNTVTFELTGKPANLESIVRELKSCGVGSRYGTIRE